MGYLCQQVVSRNAPAGGEGVRVLYKQEYPPPSSKETRVSPDATIPAEPRTRTVGQTVRLGNKETRAPSEDDLAGLGRRCHLLRFAGVSFRGNLPVAGCRLPVL